MLPWRRRAIPDQECQLLVTSLVLARGLRPSAWPPARPILNTQYNGLRLRRRSPRETSGLNRHDKDRDQGSETWMLQIFLGTLPGYRNACLLERQRYQGSAIRGKQSTSALCNLTIRHSRDGLPPLKAPHLIHERSRGQAFRLWPGFPSCDLLWD